MKKATATTCIFLDIGGGLLTNGWGHHADKKGAKLASFGLQIDEGHLHDISYATHPDDQWWLIEHQVRVVR